MTLKSKNKDFTIKVNTKGNRILVTKGFVIITSGSHYGHDRVRPDVIENDFIIPENIQIG